MNQKNIKFRVFSVQETCEKVAFEQNLSIKSVKKYASYCLSQMKSSLNRFICRICGYVLFKVFRRVMKRLLVNPAQLVKIKEAEEVCLFCLTCSF